VRGLRASLPQRSNGGFGKSGEINAPALHSNLEVPCQSYREIEMCSVFSSGKAVAANSFSDNRIKAVFTTGETSDYFDEIKELEKTVAHEAALAEAQCIIQRSIPRKSMQ